MTGAEPARARPARPALDLRRLLEPAGVAIVGASTNPARVGGQPVHCLATFGYPGRVYPVNPRHREIMGLRCYSDVAAIDGPCDLALIAVPAADVVEVVRQCGEKGIGYAVVLSSGFSETGAGGVGLQAELLRAADQAGVRVIGPNCQGLLNLPNRLYATFGAVCLEPSLRAGGVSMVTQSGGFGVSVLLTCEALGLGFRAMVSTGNQADVDTTELLDAFVDDPATKVLCAYIEAVADGRALMRVGHRALRAGKPLLIWKTGNTAKGAQAALSHTASMTGRHEVYRAAFRQSGIIEVSDTHELADFGHALGASAQPQGRRIAALGISAGACILFADEATASGLDLVDLAPQTVAALRSIVPAFGTVANPVDVTASIFNDIRSFTDAVDVVLSDPGIDQLAVLMASLPGEPAAACARALADAGQRHGKPILAGWSARRHRAEEAYRVFEQAGVPIFPSPVRLARAAAVCVRYAEARRSPQPAVPSASAGAPSGGASTAPGILNERESKDLLARWGVPITREVVLPTEGPVREAVAGLRFPVVAKVLSADLPHKSEAGGVRLALHDAAALERARAEILENVRRHAPGARLEGVMAGEMVTDGLELILAAVNDAAFGPTIALGAGGIYAEALRDMVYRIAPVDEQAALEMIRELRLYPALAGARGKPPMDLAALAAVVSVFSRKAWDERDSVLELEINPLFVRPAGSGVIAADALARVRAAT
jgi:acetyltransferase